MHAFLRFKKLGIFAILVVAILVLASVYFLTITIRNYQPRSLQSDLNTKTKNNQPKPGKCLVLEEKYCSQGKIVDWSDKDSTETIKFISIDLPENTIIFAPFDGNTGIGTSLDNFIIPNATQMEIFKVDVSAPFFYIAGDIIPDRKLDKNFDTVKKGDVIAVIGSKNNIVLTIMNYNSQDKARVPDEKELLRFLDK